MNKVVCGYDDSPTAYRALGWAVEEAQRHAARVEVVSCLQLVVPTMPPLLSPPSAAELEEEQLGALRAAALRALDRLAADRGVAHSVNVEVAAVTGSPAEQLMNRVGSDDLIVVGSRGAGGFARLLLGSVSTALVHHAPCPVLVVRGPAS